MRYYHKLLDNSKMNMNVIFVTIVLCLCIGVTTQLECDVCVSYTVKGGLIDSGTPTDPNCEDGKDITMQQECDRCAVATFTITFKTTGSTDELEANCVQRACALPNAEEDCQDIKDILSEQKMLDLLTAIPGVDITDYSGKYCVSGSTSVQNGGPTNTQFFLVTLCILCVVYGILGE